MSHSKQPYQRLSRIYANAARWLENNQGYDAHVAIMKATDRLSVRTAMWAAVTFRDAFGAWIGNDEGVLMLCFASAAARTGDI